MNFKYEEEKMLDEKLRKEFEEKMPPVFAGTEVNKLTGGALVWRTLQNKRSLKQTPESCFISQGRRKVLLNRDELLDWWFAQLQ